MPIRINLLAELQAAEELKRRDPVKRALWICASLIGLLLIWGSYLQLVLMRSRAEVASEEAKFRQIEAHYRLSMTNDYRATDALRRVSALHRLATNRFLLAEALNALQYAMVDEVQLVQLKADQAYTTAEGTKAAATSAVARAKGATAKEKIVVSMEAKDFSSSPGDQIRRFQEAINNQAYFKTNLSKIELIGRSPVQTDPSDPARPFVLFTLECQSERVR